MNKILFILKNILTIIASFLSIKFIINYGIIGYTYFIYICTGIFFIFVNIKDYIKKNRIQLNNKYNILSIIVLTIILLIFIRAYFDKNILLETAYLYQNLWYFIILLISLLFYRKINKEKDN